jgi:lactate dehydrogenase-like 2-hydroxyacid dehydrogenase
MYWSQVRVLAGPPLKMKNIICTTPIDHLPGLMDQLKKMAKVLYKPNINKSKLTKLLSENKKINIIFCNPNKQGYILDKSILKNSSIKLINTASTGLNHINIKDCKNLNIKIYSLTKDYSLINKLPSTSELAFGLMINLLRKINLSFESVKKNNWDYTKFIGKEIASLTIGIIGLGRLGKFMAKYAKSFGMDVYYCDPYVNSKKYKKISLNKLFIFSDVISIHTHVDKNTKYLIDKRLIKKAKKKPIIINTARGEIVRENDIIWGLRNNLISGYGTDVIEKEFHDITQSPIIKNLKRLNIMVTPHIGGMTYEGQLRAYKHAINKLSNFTEF